MGSKTRNRSIKRFLSNCMFRTIIVDVVTNVRTFLNSLGFSHFLKEAIEIFQHALTVARNIRSFIRYTAIFQR